MPTLKVSLPDTMQEWVEDRVRSGAYASASDYVSALIRHDREQEQTLVDALVEGENSGISSRSVDDIIRDSKAQIRDGGI